MDTALAIDGHNIRRDGEMWCLTDLWRAAGSPKDRRPVDWLRGETAQSFIEFLADSQGVEKSHFLRNDRGNPRKGEGGATWAHWQLAIAYAKWIDHAFHARVNEVYAAYKAGLLVSRSDDRDELIRLTLRMSALEEDRVSVWDRELKSELARLRRIKWDGHGVEPKGLTFPYGRVWRIVLGDTTYEELKRRNPYPRESSLHQQWLQEQRYELARRDMIRVLDTARECTSWTEFENALRAKFRRAPMQLKLAPIRLLRSAQ
jgi:hypothetical protein